MVAVLCHTMPDTNKVGIGLKSNKHNFLYRLCKQMMTIVGNENIVLVVNSLYVLQLINDVCV